MLILQQLQIRTGTAAGRPHTLSIASTFNGTTLHCSAQFSSAFTQQPSEEFDNAIVLLLGNTSAALYLTK